MNDPAAQLRFYGSRGVVIDSNLLLLYFLGSFQRSQIRTNKRLANFDEEDFDLLVRLLSLFKKVVTTPNILTEVSNLSDAVPEAFRESYFAQFRACLSILVEEYTPSSEALASRWSRFGLTDAAIATISRKRYLVLTEDFRLSQALGSDGIDALNFNHLRYVNWAQE
ncbi:MAG TPA: PIN domain-containing protein [Candidatus Eremiobacteraceae bacterium]|nr:PIN domain-containing protein [Candidatus Eremiobacteraceae bacterium]